MTDFGLSRKGGYGTLGGALLLSAFLLGVCASSGAPRGAIPPARPADLPGPAGARSGPVLPGFESGKTGAPEVRSRDEAAPEMSGPDRVLGGIAVLADGSPAAGALVNGSTVVDGQGRFSLAVASPGLLDLTATWLAPGDPPSCPVLHRAESSVDLSVEGDWPTVRLTLLPMDCSFARLRFFDEEGRPVAGVRLVQGIVPPGSSPAVESDADGRAVVRVPGPPGRSTVLRTAVLPGPGHRSLRVPVETSPGPEGPEITVVVPAPARLSVIARDGDGRELPRALSAEISLPRWEDGEPDPATPAMADRRTFWVDADPPPEGIRVEVLVPGFPRWSGHVRPPSGGGEVEVRVPLGAPAAIRGVLRDEAGLPLASGGVSICVGGCQRWTAEAGPDGSFALTGLAPGPVVVFGYRTEGRPEARREVLLRPGELHRLEDFAFAGTTTLSGRVFDAEGRAVPGAVVTVRELPEPFDADALTSSTGPDGAYRLSVPRFLSGELMVTVAGRVAARVPFDAETSRELDDAVLARY